MIITVAGIAGDQAGLPMANSRWPTEIVVAGGEGDDTPGAGEHCLRGNSLGGGALQPGHFAVPAVGQPLLEPRSRFRRVSGGDAAVVEAQFTRPLPKGRLHRWADCAMWNW